MLQSVIVVTLAASAAAFAPSMTSRSARSTLNMQADGLKIDMRGKTVFIGGVADSTGYGWAIAKACAEAGAKILLGTWPPVLPIFQMGIERGQFAEDQILSDGSVMEISKVIQLPLLFWLLTRFWNVLINLLIAKKNYVRRYTLLMPPLILKS
jgi:enoyl-[acyl-carrier protein] reductase I